MAMPLRARHQSDVAKKGQRAVGTSESPAHYGQSPLRSESALPKPWWLRQRIESLGRTAAVTEVQGTQD